jgi:hypothetical protein
MKRVILIIGLILFASPSHANYHYVSHTGSNEYPYTSWETAADSITPAMNAASPYDTIYIGTGDYQESVWADPEDTCLTFIGAGIDSTHVWENTTANMWMASNKTLVRDIFFEVYDRRTMFGGWIGAGITAIHCKFQGPGWGIFAAGNTVVEDCEFYDVEIGISCDGRNLSVRNNFFSAYVYPCHYVIEGGWYRGGIENNIVLTPILFQNCIFLNAPFDQDSVVLRNNLIDLVGHGPWINGARRPDISNNTIGRVFVPQYPRLEEGFQIERHWADSKDVKLYNNVILNADVGVRAYKYVSGDSIRASIKYNCFWNNLSDIVPDIWNWIDTIGNIDTFPMYNSLDSFDYHLQAFSPLIDAGDPAVHDVDGSRSDIGVFGGPGGTSYSYQDLPPRIPDSLFYRVWNDTIYLYWRHNYEADFFGYRLHKDTVPGFVPSGFNLIAETESSAFADGDVISGQTYYYRIASLDNQGNRSEYSQEVDVDMTGIWQGDGVEPPRMTAIESNYPNPFNSATTLIYAVANLGPLPAQINIDIYDVQGRKVRTLVDERKEVGRHRIIWDGRDDSGNELSSGIYFARICQWHADQISRNQKLVLIR